MVRALFTLAIEDSLLILTDVGKAAAVSITNDAEAVIAELHLMLGDDMNGKRIIYRDTMQMWDGLAHRGDRFLGFVLLQASSRALAIEQALSVKDWPV